MADEAQTQEFLDDVNEQAMNLDPLSGLGSSNPDFKMPTVEEVWDIIQQMEGISDEERESLRKSLYSPQDGSPEDFFKNLGQPQNAHSSWEYTIFLAMVAILVLVFALFGYKLYKSLMEKELKKQEKVKNKHTKKSKKNN
ncbi:uncharacterized protein LOC119685102 isoform X1 [Teleopsis dalmanni]|uniref:uncharacterized protein LOC119685102 isoform X1 n=1 Tax=Teleopsis dalmanni TaxID=139649 RepID=UPI0018CE3F0D|nr:uncharacterized protein LOC119685102 isoform X1 [Teleopsis dalmanni]XP_037955233.1 uncharacterized protein LOC119685102 isoform X1 [Teleopsis dalmanni]XP_037955234.1 uncharacterized protein LOC119685102 isoform X1 [Teleopsis dalmanni]